MRVVIYASLEGDVPDTAKFLAVPFVDGSRLPISFSRASISEARAAAEGWWKAERGKAQAKRPKPAPKAKPTKKRRTKGGA